MQIFFQLMTFGDERVSSGFYPEGMLCALVCHINNCRMSPCWAKVWFSSTTHMTCFTVLPSLLSCISLLPALCFLCRMDVSRQVGGQTPVCPPSWELREKQLGSVWPRTSSGENPAWKIKVLLLGHRTGILGIQFSSL